MSTALTGPGRAYERSPEERHIMCYMDDGRLLVSKSHTNDARVTSFKAFLQRKKESVTVVPVDMQSISDAYESSTAPTKDASTKMQKMAMDLFYRGVLARASDIHIRVSKRYRTQVFFRIHNDLTHIEEHSSELGEQLCTAIYQAMCDVSDSTFKLTGQQDARISDRSKLPEVVDGIRIATTGTVDGHLMVLRLLYNDAHDGDIKSLGYADQHINAFTLMKRRPTGINIIAGPTGSGKSTTQARLLTGFIQETNGRKHVITVEDPPEYPIQGAVQTPVTNAETESERSLEFQRSIAATMRLDPDVIMIGEIRDTASADLALRAAMTGHQVWSTLHANNALAIIDRLRDLGIPLPLLCDPSIITGLICQRLVKTLCPHCKKPLKTAQKGYKEHDINRILAALRNTEHVYVMGKGCAKCNHTGTAGRTALAEIIIPDEQLMQFIQKEDRIGARRYWKNDQQGRSMISHAIEKAEAGLIDPFMAEDAIGPLIMEDIESDFRINSHEIKVATV